jgi:hypothetical protein
MQDTSRSNPKPCKSKCTTYIQLDKEKSPRQFLHRAQTIVLLVPQILKIEAVHASETSVLARIRTVLVTGSASLSALKFAVACSTPNTIIHDMIARYKAVSQPSLQFECTWHLPSIFLTTFRLFQLFCLIQPSESVS